MAKNQSSSAIFLFAERGLQKTTTKTDFHAVVELKIGQ